MPVHLLFGAGEIDLEGGSFSRLGVDPDVSARLLYDPVHRGETHTRSLTLLLGGKEGVKDAVGGLRVHARSVVGDRQHHVLSLIHISEPTRRTPNSYAVFCLK